MDGARVVPLVGQGPPYAIRGELTLVQLAPRAAHGAESGTTRCIGLPVSQRLRLPRLIVSLALVTLLGACATKGGDNIKLDAALFNYAGAIRFSDIERAYEFVDPKLRVEKPMSRLEWERYAQVQFTGYLVKAKEPASQGEVRQLVEVRLINRHSQVERVFTVRELWRWDAEAKQWWLTTGLPDISQG